nr:hypothetical protein K-LCC10_0494 [Kaumoebavirus]
MHRWRLGEEVAGFLDRRLPREITDVIAKYSWAPHPLVGVYRANISSIDMLKVKYLCGLTREYYRCWRCGKPMSTIIIPCGNMESAYGVFMEEDCQKKGMYNLLMHGDIAIVRSEYGGVVNKMKFKVWK